MHIDLSQISLAQHTVVQGKQIFRCQPSSTFFGRVRVCKLPFMQKPPADLLVGPEDMSVNVNSIGGPAMEVAHMW